MRLPCSHTLTHSLSTSIIYQHLSSIFSLASALTHSLSLSHFSVSRLSVRQFGFDLKQFTSQTSQTVTSNTCLEATKTLVEEDDEEDDDEKILIFETNALLQGMSYIKKVELLKSLQQEYLTPQETHDELEPHVLAVPATETAITTTEVDVMSPLVPEGSYSHAGDYAMV